MGDTIKKAWIKYIKNKEPIPDYISGVRKEIVASWKRCQKHVPCHIEKAEVIEDNQLHTLLENNSLLIDIAYPYLVNFYNDFEKEHFMIMLTDKNGCMLKSIGYDQEVGKMIEDNHFVDGSYFDESHIGTGGVGLCLAIKECVVVKGYEHYNDSYHDLICYGAPLQNLKNEIIGSISITGPKKYEHTTIMSSLKVAKKAIEKEFELTRTNHILNNTINITKAGMIVLDSRHTVLFSNMHAKQLLHVEILDQLENIFDKKSVEIINALNNTNNYECTLINKYNEHLYLSLSIKEEYTHSLYTKMIIFESQEEKHRQASLLAGFQAHYTFNDVKGISSLMKHIKEVGRLCANMDTPILLKGHKGCEVDVIAQAIHNEGKRKDYPFITLDCSSIPQDTFIHELNGSLNEVGKLELAHGGTIFLYEISRCSLESQDYLYHFINEQTIQKENSFYLKKLDVRFIVHTSKDLLKLVESNQFNKQLYYLLNSMSMVVPPLVERKEDIPVLVRDMCKNQESIIFEQECMQALQTYHWPGNTSQLKTVIENAIYSSQDNIIKLNHLPLEIVNNYYLPEDDVVVLQDKLSTTSSQAKEYNEMMIAIKKTHGNVEKASKLLYIPTSTMYRKLKKYNINPKDYKKTIG